MAVSGKTNPSTDADNWKIYVEWKRTDYNVEKKTETIKARLHLGYYTTTGVSNLPAYITINGTKKKTTLSAKQNWWNYGDYAPFEYRSVSDWLTWTIKMNDNGNASIKVSGSFPLNYWHITKQVYENPTTGPKTWSLDKVDMYSNGHGSSNNGSSWNHTRFAYKSTDYGKSWSKCNLYKSTNSGGAWSKLQ